MPPSNKGAPHGANTHTGSTSAKNLKPGGAIRGKGTETSDDVPIMASTGEFMIKASSAKKIGLGALRELNALGDDEPQAHEDGESKKVEAKEKRDEKAGRPEADGMKCGGAVRKMAAGGLVDTDAERKRQAAVEQIPTGGDNPAPAAQAPNWATDSDVGRNVSNALMAVAPAAPAMGAMRTLAGANRVGTALESIGGATAGTTMAAVKPIAPYAVPLAGLVAANSASTPDTTLSATPATPVTAATKSIPTASTTGAERGEINPVSVDPSVSKPFGASPGQVVRDGNSYSGTNVSGDANFVDKQGGALKARGGFVSGSGDGTFGYGGTGSAVGAGASGGGDQALYQARLGAIRRGDTEAVRTSYGGNFGGKTKDDYPIDALMNDGKPMNAMKAKAISELQLGALRRTQDSDANKLARDKFGLEAKSAGLANQKTLMELASERQMQDAKTAYANAKTPQEQKVAGDRLRLLMGKGDAHNTWKGIALQGSTDSMNNKTEGILAAVNEQTGEMRRFDQGSGAPKAAPLQNHVDALKKNPSLAEYFDAQYGPGAAAKIIGAK